MTEDHPKRGWLSISIVLVVSALCLPAVFAVNRQAIKNRAGLTAEARALVRQAMSSTGLISVRNASDSPAQGARPRGSAVIVRPDGLLVTNFHVITNTRTARSYDEIFFSLSADGDAVTLARYRIKPMLMNKDYDLALLRVESDDAGNPVPKSFTFPTVDIGDSRKIRLLEDLFIIGFPEKGGSTITVNRGVVEGKDILANWIKTDARVIHGNSGGAAVNSEGKLIGIPTKVVADEQPIDKDGDGFPDDYRRYGAVGFLRPAHLVAEMIAKLEKNSESRQMPSPKVVEPVGLVTVRGIVKSAASGKPIAGALVGLLPAGESNVTEGTLLTWGSTNSEGAFKLNKQVPPGRYTIKAKALANQVYTREIEIGPASSMLIIEIGSTDK